MGKLDTRTLLTEKKLTDLTYVGTSTDGTTLDGDGKLPLSKLFLHRSFLITDPALGDAVTTTIIDNYQLSIVTLTTTGNQQNPNSPTDPTPGKEFSVALKDAPTGVTLEVNGVKIAKGEVADFVWDGSQWLDQSHKVKTFLVTTEPALPPTQGALLYAKSDSEIYSKGSNDGTNEFRVTNPDFLFINLKAAAITPDLTYRGTIYDAGSVRMLYQSGGSAPVALHEFESPTYSVEAGTRLNTRWCFGLFEHSNPNKADDRMFMGRAGLASQDFCVMRSGRVSINDGTDAFAESQFNVAGDVKFGALATPAVPTSGVKAYGNSTTNRLHGITSDNIDGQYLVAGTQQIFNGVAPTAQEFLDIDFFIMRVSVWNMGTVATRRGIRSDTTLIIKNDTLLVFNLNATGADNFIDAENVSSTSLVMAKGDIVHLKPSLTEDKWYIVNFTDK